MGRLLIKLFGNKKVRYRNLLLVLLPLILIMGFFGFMAYKGYKDISNNSENTPVKKNDPYYIEEMNYSLRKNATDYQMEVFNELKEACKAEERNYEDIAVAVCKNYIADFYTWTNKAGRFDVGGMNFVYSPNKRNIYSQARDTFYNNLNIYIDKYGSENLLEVSNIDLWHVYKIDDVTIDGTVCEAYYVHLQWQWADTVTFPTDNLVTRGIFTVVINPNNGRVEIADGYN